MRLQEAMVSAGVNESRVSLEVLFWLPPEFMRAYQELFMRALHLGDGDDTERAGRDEGRQKSSVRDGGKDGGLRTRARSKLREGEEGEVADGKGGRKKAQGGGTTRGARPGKKYKREWVVKDEDLLEVKKKVDAVLRGLVPKEMRKLVEREGRIGEGRETRGSIPGGETRGSTPGGRLLPMAGGKGGKQCEECGRIAARDWVRCPFPHS